MLYIDIFIDKFIDISFDAVRILKSEIIRIFTHLINVKFNFKIKKLFGFMRIGIASSYIAWPSWRDLIRQGLVAGFLVSLQDFKDCIAFAASDIDDFNAIMFTGIFNSLDVSFGKIDDMDIITYACTVFSIVIVAKYI